MLTYISLNISIISETIKLRSTSYQNELLKQYLRKFRFFYLYYYLKAYPNDLSTLSIKKINMIAIQSLFFLTSI